MNKKVIIACLLCVAIVPSYATPLQYEALGNLISFQKHATGLNIKASNAQVKVEVFNAATIRIRATQNDAFEEQPYTVIVNPSKIDYEVKDEGKQIILSTSSLILHITKEPLRFTFLTKDKKVISEDDPGFGIGWIGDESFTHKKLQPNERFVGLGEKTGNLDRRGSGYTNYNTDYYAYPTNGDPLYTTFPFYMGIHNGLSYGIYMNNSYKSHFNFGASTDRFSSFSAEGGDMDYFFIYDENISGIIKNYTWLTGRMPMPPLWGLGYQQCRYSYYPDTEVINIAKTFREKDIPADVIYLDIHYMDNYKIFTWDNERFPNPKGMLDQLEEMGFKVVIIVDPGIKIEEGYSSYHEGLDQDIFLKYSDGSLYAGQVWPGWCHFADFTRKDARNWWGNSFKGYVNDGIDGFWNDMNEIATWGQKLPENIHFNMEGTGGVTKKARNVYGMQMTRSTYEGTKKLLGKRPFILTRAGFSGVQRYSAVWTGDNVSSEDHMMLGVRLVNSLGLTGVSFAGPDVGGFAGIPGVSLFSRWISIGAFTPFYRGHTQINSKSSEPWSFGEEAEEISRNYLKIRYRLMPYIYSTFYESTQNGMPVARSLVIDYTHDQNIYNGHYQHEYLFGEALLVAPFRSDKEFGRLYLPKGKWYDFYTDELSEGNTESVIPLKASKLPVYVKAGSIIPMQSDVRYTADKTDGILRVHIYASNEANSFVYYEDDGESYNYQNGQYLKRAIRYNPTSRQITFDKVEGKYNSKFDNVELVLHGFDALKEAKVNGKRIKAIDNVVSVLNPISHFDPIGKGQASEKIAVKTLGFKHSKGEVAVKW